MRAQIVHLLPYDGIGGVEVAARTLLDGIYGELQFSKYYLVDKSETKNVSRNKRTSPNYTSENDPRAYIRTIWKLFFIKPDLLIVSLWRSCIVALVLKAFRPNTKVVTFLHSATSVHWLDRILNLLTMYVSCQIWADSTTTLTARIPKHLQKAARVISFLIEHQPTPEIKYPKPEFVYWGRLHHQKGVSRSLRIFARIQDKYPGSLLYLVGPDGGDKKRLEEQVKSQGISGVTFLGKMQRADIISFAAGCSFYLQTSVEEGMAMSVVEAMQIGLVPVVTPVGEIGSYCIDGYNSVYVRDNSTAVNEVEMLLQSPDVFKEYSRRAYLTWENKNLYRDDVLKACMQLIT